jgi:hypothetical protein
MNISRRTREHLPLLDSSKRGEKALDIYLDNLEFDILKLIDETGQYVEYNLRKELAINEDNFQEAMLTQPASYIYWSSILEKLKLYQETKELELEKVLAQLDQEARDHIKKDGTKPTKDMVDAYVKRHDDYQAKQKEVVDYNYIVGRMQRIVKAFEQRKDMLQSYGKQVTENTVYGSGAGSRMVDTPPPPPFLQQGGQ